jgi:ABC-2 type transport system permease protein
VTRRALRWELRKLAAQRRTYVGVGAAAGAPVLLAVAIVVHPPSPTDSGLPFFLRFAVESGFALPLLSLLFSALFLFPLVTALVAGDIVAAEDHNRTLKTILTRSASRSSIFAAKVAAAFAYVLVAVVTMGVAGTLAGGLASGFHPLPTFSTVISPSRALALVAGSFALYALPVLALAAIGILLSTVSRNSAAAVVGTLMAALLMQLIGILPGLGGLQPYLLTTQFQAWQGFFQVPTDWLPIGRAAWVCAVYAIPMGVAAYLIFLRRDVAGG